MPRINFLPASLSDPTPETTKRRIALAQALSQQATTGDKVYSNGYGMAKVGASILSGILEKKAEDDENEADEKAWSSAAAALPGSGGASSGGSGADSSASSASSGSPAVAASPSPDSVAAARSNEATKANQKEAYDLLTTKGYSPEAASGIIGNLTQESGLNTGIMGDNGTSGGIAQWHNERLTGLKDFAQKQGTDWRDLKTQIDFLDNELRGPESKAFAALQAAKTPEEAATAFMHFERPQGYTPDNPTAGHGYANRARYAQDVHKLFAGTQAAQANPADLPAPGAAEVPLTAPGPTQDGFVIPGAGPVGAPAPGVGVSPGVSPGGPPATAPLPPPRPASSNAQGMPPVRASAPAAAPAGLPGNLLSDLSPSQVMELQGPNRQQVLASILQSNPETARASGPDPRLLAQALQNSPAAPTAQDQGAPPSPLQGSQGGVPASPGAVTPETAVAPAGGSPGDVSATGSVPAANPVANLLRNPRTRALGMMLYQQMQSQQATQRQQALDQQKTLEQRAYDERMQRERWAHEDSKPMAVAPGTVIYDPSTKQPIFSAAPKFGRERALSGAEAPEVTLPPADGGNTAQVQAPQAGAVVDGFRFKGGNPADQSSWERVQ